MNTKDIKFSCRENIAAQNSSEEFIHWESHHSRKKLWSEEVITGICPSFPGKKQCHQNSGKDGILYAAVLSITSLITLMPFVCSVKCQAFGNLLKTPTSWITKLSEFRVFIQKMIFK